MERISRGTLRSERLTWSDKGPAPFESAWNLLLKVQLLNAVGIQELSQLGLVVYRERETRRLFTSQADWDIPRIASCLHVDVARIRTAFIDCLGFPAPRDGQYAVRHCPDCRAVNYHCTLFNLPMVSRCPWHEKELVHGCDRCGRSSTRLDRRPGRDLPRWNCPDCGYVVDLDADRNVNLVSDETEKVIRVHCQRLIDWWTAIQRAAGDASALLDPLANTVRPFDCDWMWRLNWAAGVCPPPPGWGVTPCTFAAGSILRFPVGERAQSPDGAQHYSAYRLIRKSIFRQFISPHAECLSELQAMDPFERISLDRSTLCTVCLAFLSWRVAHEGQIPVFDPHGGRISRPRLETVESVGSPAHGGDHEILNFANFLRIWAQIEHCTSVSACRIELSPERSVLKRIPHVVVRSEEHEELVCLIPSAAQFSAIALERCSKRRSSGTPMARAPAAYARARWNVADESLLFAAHNHESQFRNAYQYVYV
ncbi:hypothetical protein OKW46_005288 [Paraburkholderia sp. WSM4179]|nr:hypothetical protein [Paraburkholderia sp. WSM4179]